MDSFWMWWLVSLGVAAITVVGAGLALPKRWYGAFIDSRNTWSLSQFQLVLWTLIGLPAILGVAAWRAFDDPSTAWDFSIPGELLALMGISLASAVTSLAIKATKNEDDPAAVGARGSTGRPPIADMFAVEEGSKALRAVDLTKLQNFLLSIGLMATYLAMVLTAVADAGSTPIDAMPAFSPAMVGLLAISHGGYLIAKVPGRRGEPVAEAGPTGGRAAIARLVDTTNG